MKTTILFFLIGMHCALTARAQYFLGSNPELKIMSGHYGHLYAMIADRGRLKVDNQYFGDSSNAFGNRRSTLVLLKMDTATGQTVWAKSIAGDFLEHL